MNSAAEPCEATQAAIAAWVAQLEKGDTEEAAATKRMNLEVPGLVCCVWTDYRLFKAVQNAVACARSAMGGNLDRNEQKEADRAARAAQAEVAVATLAAEKWMLQAKRIFDAAGFTATYAPFRSADSAIDEPDLPILMVVGISTDSEDPVWADRDWAVPTVICKHGFDGDPPELRGNTGSSPGENLLDEIRGSSLGRWMSVMFSANGTTMRSQMPVPPALCLPDGLPVADWADGLRLGYSFADFKNAMEGYGGNPALAAVSIAQKVPPRRDHSCTIDGLLPSGALTLLGGAAGKGKTSLMLDMAHAIRSGAPEWAGFTIPDAVRGKAVALLYAEDGEADMRTRLASIAAERGPADVLLINRSMGTLDEVLGLVRSVPNLGAVFIDPLLPWLSTVGGADENDNTKVGSALDRFVALASELGIAVVVSHHLGAMKRARDEPRTPDDVLRAIRGAQVIRDRPRCVLTLHRDGNEAVLGVAKSNMQKAVPERAWRLSYDPATGMFARIGEWLPRGSGRNRTAQVPRPGAGPSGSPAAGEPAAPKGSNDAGVAAGVVARLVAGGAKVTQTGKSELFLYMQRGRPPVPEMAGWPRGRCRAAVAAAVAAGALVNDPGVGLQPAAPAPALPVPEAA